jgi:spore germination protein KA
LRFIRFLSAVWLRRIYVALSTFIRNCPTKLLLTMMNAHEGVAVSGGLEAGLMVVAFEILKEPACGFPARSARPSALSARWSSAKPRCRPPYRAPMNIVVAITAVASFVVPPQSDSGAIITLLFLGSAGFMGGYGIAIGLLNHFYLYGFRCGHSERPTCRPWLRSIRLI